MKTLYLCRHAKSSWSAAGMADHDRPLNDRGQKNAPHMARMFAERGEPLDLIVSSTAERAKTTAAHFAAALRLPKEAVILEPAIYHAAPDQLLKLVNKLPEKFERVMLFGHNPGFTNFLEYLTEAGVDNMPTCGLARIDLDQDQWSLVSGGTGTLVWFDYPKRHPGQD